ncbi:MAG: TRAM domain-containing protein, partial [Verrucomicrobia bacterium]|nr:TRAM domain-containing protein [Verrucomicrobiota bacterium]
IVEVLVEGVSRRNVNRLQGRSRCNKIVVFEGPAEWVGTIRKFKVTRAGQYSLYGEPV